MTLIEQVEDIVNKTYDWEVFSGVIEDYHWRIILTPEGHEVNLCHKENFDRWANSEYKSLLTDELQFYEARDKILEMLNK